MFSAVPVIVSHIVPVNSSSGILLPPPSSFSISSGVFPCLSLSTASSPYFPMIVTASSPCTIIASTASSPYFRMISIASSPFLIRHSATSSALFEEPFISSKISSILSAKPSICESCFNTSGDAPRPLAFLSQSSPVSPKFFANILITSSESPSFLRFVTSLLMSSSFAPFANSSSTTSAPRDFTSLFFSVRDNIGFASSENNERPTVSITSNIVCLTMISPASSLPSIYASNSLKVCMHDHTLTPMHTPARAICADPRNDTAPAAAIIFIDWKIRSIPSVISTSVSPNSTIVSYITSLWVLPPFNPPDILYEAVPSSERTI